jgi:hypothetical protein
MSIDSVDTGYLGSIKNYFGWGSSPDVQATASAASSSATSAPQDPAKESSASVGSVGQAVETNLSTAATLLSTLSSLEKQDPEAFKKTADEIAESLHVAAEATADATEKSQLDNLAGKFSNAATTGSLTSVTSDNSASGARGYGKSAQGLFSSYLGGDLNPNALQEVNTLVQKKLSALSARQ